MKQITVVVDDKVGVLADISFILGKAKINIESIDVNVAGGKAVITLVVKDAERAASLLHANGYRVMESSVIVVHLQDRPGELSKVSKLLSENGVNIESVHLLTRGEGLSLYSLKLDKQAKGEKLLSGYMRPSD